MCRRAPPPCFRATTPPKLRDLSLLVSVGLSPTGCSALNWTRRARTTRADLRARLDRRHGSFHSDEDMPPRFGTSTAMKRSGSSPASFVRPALLEGILLVTGA